MDQRQRSLRHWAEQLVSPAVALVAWQVVAGDASARRYFRAQAGEHSWICVDAPPKTEKNQSFVDVQRIFEQGGVRVPAVLHADLAQGFLLLEDLGDELMLGHLSEQRATTLYPQAMAMLLDIQGLQSGAASLPEYSQIVLKEELSRFPQWFCAALLNMSMSAAEEDLLADLNRLLLQSAAQQPQVLVHRDFHSRNLLLVGAGELATIDFQDAVRGPLCYDLVSLLKDCYVCWPPAEVRAWALSYRVQLLRAGRPAGDDSELFLRWFDWIGLQRHLKVLGNFARLALRDGKPQYLNNIPLVLHYVLETMANYPEFAAAHRWFVDQLVPRYERLAEHAAP